MNNFKIIEHKLQKFTQKFYTSELIRGVILFLSLGCIYLFFTLFLEYFLWLKPTARTILFWVFILVELFLLIRFIAFPIFKLIGLRKGISYEQASALIGSHFPEVQDKLLNMLQLQNSTTSSDLLYASIHQKSKELQPIPFAKAVDFKHNTRYLKYAIVPIIIWLVTLFSGFNTQLSESLQRVVNYEKAYIPPAPFAFYVSNKNLQVIQGQSFTLKIDVIGNVIPKEAKIFFDSQDYYLQNNGNGSFSYTFRDVQQPIQFSLKANNVSSQEYEVSVVKIPTIETVFLDLKYPKYLNKINESVLNFSNISVPEGTKVIWKVNTHQTDTVSLIYNSKRIPFTKNAINSFSLSKSIRSSMNYQITTTNRSLKDFENLQYAINTIKDDFPQIAIQSNLDSTSRGNSFFVGQIADDYGLKKLQLVYYNQDNPQEIKLYNIAITKENIQTFYYEFPNNLDLKKGINYELYFEVFDNDAVNGSKKAKSKIFTFRKKKDEEIEEEFLLEQRNTIQFIENTITKRQKQHQDLERVNRDLQAKKKINFNDKKRFQKFVKRQHKYNQMMQRQTDKLQYNLKQDNEESALIKHKKEELKKRIQELKKLQKQQKLLDEIQKMADKLNKDDLLQKTKQLAQQNKQQERSLERILELTKRFYIEQKTMQIAKKIEQLSIKQNDLINQDKNIEAQRLIKKDFEQIKKELSELDKDNNNLKDPMNLPKVDEEAGEVDDELNNSEKNLSLKKNIEAKKSQKNASHKMQQMSAKMQQQIIEMEGDFIEENIDDLRKILENLVTFSFKQESLMKKFSNTSTSHPDFGKDLKSQNLLKSYFEHIDDSLYVLSMKVPKISTIIKDDLSTIHYNLEQSLDNFSENRFTNGVSNQRYVMSSVNSLSDYLSNILNNMKNSMSLSIKKGQGKKGKGSGFSLPDLIQKQKGLSKKMKQGLQKGLGKSGKEKGQNGKPKNNDNNSKETGKLNHEKITGSGQGNNDSNDDLNGELYKIYQQQSLLRQELENQINEAESSGNNSLSKARKALKKMEDLENEILEKGFNLNTLTNMQNLNYELLKLDSASLKQGKDKNRKSNTNNNEYQNSKIKALQLKQQFYNQTEILNRQSLPLRQNYKNKVREYFSLKDKK